MIALELIRGDCPVEDIEFCESDDYYTERSNSSKVSEDS